MDKHQISAETGWLAPDEESLQQLESADPLLACAGAIIGSFLGEFRRISIIAIAEHGPFDQDHIDELFAKIAVGMVFSGHFDPGASPEATMARRAEIASRITNRMLVAAELDKPQRIHEFVSPGDAQNLDNQNQESADAQANDTEEESARGSTALASERPEDEGGTGWPRYFPE